MPKLVYWGLLISYLAAIEGQPIECGPCECFHENYTLLVKCVGNVQNLQWNAMPHLETLARFLDAEDFAFHYLPAIWRNLTTELEITHTNLEDLDLMGYYVIKKLIMSHIAIVSKADLINAPTSLKEFSITDSSLSEISIPPDQPLISLDLSNNQLTSIPIVNSLKSLSLRNNSLVGLLTTGGDCQPMLNLARLDISFNRIYELPETAFKCILGTGYLNLHLNLSHNHLRNINERAFAGLQISTIDLSHNKLKTIGSGILPWKAIQYLNLQYNPWNCECNAQWMLDELMPLLFNTTPSLLYSFRCETPSKLRDKSLAFWLHHSNEVFCGTPAAFEFTSPLTGETYEMWTGQIIICIVLGVVIVGLIVAIIAVWAWPKKMKQNETQTRTRPRPPSSNPRYSLVNGGLREEDKF